MATSGYLLATSGYLDLATRGYFFMATDTRRRVCVASQDISHDDHAPPLGRSCSAEPGDTLAPETVEVMGDGQSRVVLLAEVLYRLQVRAHLVQLRALSAVSREIQRIDDNEHGFGVLHL